MVITEFKPEYCNECGKEMIETSDEFLSCPDAHGKLRPKPKDYRKELRLYKRRKWRGELPLAFPIGKRHGRKETFRIDGKNGVFVLDGRGYACLMATDGIAVLLGCPRKFICVCPNQKEAD